MARNWKMINFKRENLLKKMIFFSVAHTKIIKNSMKLLLQKIQLLKKWMKSMNLLNKV